MNNSLFIVIQIVLITAKSYVYTRPVQTDTGPVIGEILQTVTKGVDYFSFRGIPYAEVPVRFQSPEPKKPWNDVLYATSDKDRCIQTEKKNVTGSEDCLYLNVYTPANQSVDSNLLPVIVWIHGGAFTTGYASKSYYGPDFLVEAGVVVVAPQYRLGPLGFLNVNHPNASGNNGLKDQVMALKWVQRNIHLFNGDPNRITLMGQSAGGVSVDLHKLSNMSSGLFHQTISMSASPLCKYWAFQSHVEARVQAFLLGAKLGYKTDNEEELLNFLRNNVTADEIIEKADRLPGVPFRPTLERSDLNPDDEKFLTECTPKLYHEGRYNKGPTMMGYTSNEILFLAKSLDDLIQYHEDAARSVKSIGILNLIPFVPKIVSVPFKKVAGIKKAAFTELIEELSDIYFVTGIDMKQKLLSKHNDAPVYYYRYLFKSSQSAHKSEGIENLDGVAHEDELPHIFHRPHVDLDLNGTRIALIRERLVKLWTNFAKYGNPTPDGESDPLLGVNWPDSGPDGIHLEINDNLTVGERPVGNLVKLYQKLGFGDSNIYNDCDRSVLNDVINGIANVPGKTMAVISDAKETVGKVAHGISDAKDSVKDKITNAKQKSIEKISDVVSGAKKHIPVIG